MRYRMAWWLRRLAAWVDESPEATPTGVAYIDTGWKGVVIKGKTTITSSDEGVTMAKGPFVT